MGKRLSLRLGTASVSLWLNESQTAAALLAATPFEAAANRWGQEIYFATPVAGEAAEATAETVTLGEVGFWPPGSALCLFCGPTPLSVDDEIRPASAVVIVGRIEATAAELALLDEIADGTPVAVEATDGE